MANAIQGTFDMPKPSKLLKISLFDERCQTSMDTNIVIPSKEKHMPYVHEFSNIDKLSVDKHVSKVRIPGRKITRVKRVSETNHFTGMKVPSRFDKSTSVTPGLPFKEATGSDDKYRRDHYKKIALSQFHPVHDRQTTSRSVKIEFARSSKLVPLLKRAGSAPKSNPKNQFTIGTEPSKKGDKMAVSSSNVKKALKNKLLSSKPVDDRVGMSSKHRKCNKAESVSKETDRTPYDKCKNKPSAKVIAEVLSAAIKTAKCASVKTRIRTAKLKPLKPAKAEELVADWYRICERRAVQEIYKAKDHRSTPQSFYNDAPNSTDPIYLENAKNTLDTTGDTMEELVSIKDEPDDMVSVKDEPGGNDTIESIESINKKQNPTAYDNKLDCKDTMEEGGADIDKEQLHMLNENDKDAITANKATNTFGIEQVIKLSNGDKESTLDMPKSPLDARKTKWCGIYFYGAVPNFVKQHYKRDTLESSRNPQPKQHVIRVCRNRGGGDEVGSSSVKVDTVLPLDEDCLRYNRMLGKASGIRPESSSAIAMPILRGALVTSVQESFKPSIQESFKLSVQESFKPSVQESFKPVAQEFYQRLPGVQETCKPVAQKTCKPVAQEICKPDAQKICKPDASICKLDAHELFKPTIQEDYETGGRETYRVQRPVKGRARPFLVSKQQGRVRPFLVRKQPVETRPNMDTVSGTALFKRQEITSKFEMKAKEFWTCFNSIKSHMARHPDVADWRFGGNHT